MDKLTIKTEIPVIVIVTENFKQKLAFSLQEQLREIDLEIQQLEFTSRRTLMEAERLGQSVEVQKRLEETQKKIVDMKQKVLTQLKQVAKLQTGDEIVQGKTEGIVEIGVGDNWLETQSLKIVIKDDRVVEIRRG